MDDETDEMTDRWMESFISSRCPLLYTSVCPVPKAQVCVCQGGEANFLLIFPPSFLSLFLYVFLVHLPWYVLCSLMFPNNSQYHYFLTKLSQMIFKNVLPCQVSISRERIYQCPLPLFTTIGYMTLTWEINPLRKN